MWETQTSFFLLIAGSANGKVVSKNIELLFLQRQKVQPCWYTILKTEASFPAYPRLPTHTESRNNNQHSRSFNGFAPRGTKNVTASSKLLSHCLLTVHCSQTQSLLSHSCHGMLGLIGGQRLDFIKNQYWGLGIIPLLSLWSEKKGVS